MDYRGSGADFLSCCPTLKAEQSRKLFQKKIVKWSKERARSIDADKSDDSNGIVWELSAEPSVSRLALSL